jgi:hypothetical protein
MRKLQFQCLSRNNRYDESESTGRRPPSYN